LKYNSIKFKERSKGGSQWVGPHHPLSHHKEYIIWSISTPYLSGTGTHTVLFGYAPTVYLFYFIFFATGTRFVVLWYVCGTRIQECANFFPFSFFVFYLCDIGIDEWNLVDVADILEVANLFREEPELDAALFN
jgi:hypothetical protein